MRYREILEESSNLSAFLNKNAYITFRFVKELKVPLPTDVEHVDPAGIYTFPLDIYWDLFSRKKLSYMNRPYLHILQPKKKVWKFSQISSVYFNQAIEIIKSMVADKPNGLSANEVRRMINDLEDCSAIFPEALDINDPRAMIDIMKDYISHPEKIVWKDAINRDIPEDHREYYITKAKKRIADAEEILDKNGESLTDKLGPLVHEIEESGRQPGSKLWYLVTEASVLAEHHHDSVLSEFSRDVFLKLGMEILEDDIGSQIYNADGSEKYQAVFLTDDSYTPLALFDN